MIDQRSSSFNDVLRANRAKVVHVLEALLHSFNDVLRANRAKVVHVVQARHLAPVLILYVLALRSHARPTHHVCSRSEQNDTGSVSE